VSRLVGSLRSEQHPILNTSEAYAIVVNTIFRAMGGRC
jgi:hypothetical protein